MVVNNEDYVPVTGTVQLTNISYCFVLFSGAAQISGWGYTKKRKNGEQFNDLYYPSKLHFAEVDIISKDDCLRAYRSSSIMTRLAKNQKNFIW